MLNTNVITFYSLYKTEYAWPGNEILHKQFIKYIHFMCKVYLMSTQVCMVLTGNQ